ncbi:PP2C family protein-serine/threonine phosphatase [Mesomycoplasma lagogenitalium]|uniref:Serine/threonine-protein phosphatase n=1 Tax=Mesomycoplasma lagogenitalium TaxID=171286 RepID=A0ABY8LUY4_9BACT|nr:serine/threonine-protein phosphatase [Mesomycoplasma lagogenitalium]WGI36540.1 serine/threonine-protein phosphatase [Mesomycoplasma lagogenitalium]
MNSNFYSLSKIGKRKENQDAVYAKDFEDVSFGIICDGMGGHADGAIASSIAVNTFKDLADKQIPQSTEEEVHNWFLNGLESSINNMELSVKNNKHSLDMGTTLVAFLHYKKENLTYVLNIGDSRGYLYLKYLNQITEDQNVFNRLVNEENISFEEAQRWPGAFQLTSCLGPRKNQTPTISKFKLPNIDDTLIILTTDGVHNSISKPIMENILFQKDKSLEDKAHEIVDIAFKNGSTDNLTILIFELDLQNV